MQGAAQRYDVLQLKRGLRAFVANVEGRRHVRSVEAKLRWVTRAHTHTLSRSHSTHHPTCGVFGWATLIDASQN